MIHGGKSKYVSLLSLIKDESKPLYELISDLCIDHTFRSQKYKKTFLMPNEKLVKHIKKLVDDDQDVEAIDIIRSLLLKGHYEISDFKEGSVIGTNQYDPSILSHPDKVGKDIKKSDKMVIATNKGAHDAIVYKYTSDSSPETKQSSASGGQQLVGTVSGGNQKCNYRVEVSKKASQLIGSNAEETIVNFKNYVCGMLALIEDDTEKYKRAKFYLAENPILSYYFLTLPGSGISLIDEEKFKSAASCPDGDVELIKKAQNLELNVDKKVLVDMKRHRGDCVNKGDKATLHKLMKTCYSDIVKEQLKYEAIDDELCKNVELKMLMDELRFRYESIIGSLSEIKDMVTDLNSIDWSSPEKHHVVCSKEITSILGPEAFASGPALFVKSIYFMNMPLTEEMKDSLSSQKGGARCDSNPSEVGTVIFSGGAARKKISSYSGSKKLESMVKTLSKQQREALKQML